jgi:hypothetical protein
MRAVRKSLSLLVVLALAAIGAAIATATPAAASGPNTVVVGNGDLAPNGHWQLEPSSNTGSFSFVAGPSPTPGGTGSLAMSIASGQHEWLNNYGYGACATTPSCDDAASMTPITNLDALSYSTYRTSGSTMPTFNIEVYTTGVDNYTTFAFVPDAGSVTDNTWQSWDGMNPSDGVWYSSHNVGSGVFNCGPFACSASWSQITASYPNAKVVYGLGPNLGTGGTFTGNIDDFTVGVSGTTNVYDFEPDCTTTCSVDAASGDDNNTGLSGDPLKTIQAGIDKASSGGSVQVAAGTYTENVVVDNSLQIVGAGSSTIVEPGVSGPNPCSGDASLCAGASNVFLVQADNVSISQLTVDGDNPALTGLAVGGADVDARNGIITNHQAGTYNGLSVDHVTIKNIYLRGVYASSGGTFSFTNDAVDNVKGDQGSIGMFDFGGAGTMSNNNVSNANDAISANHSRGTTFSGNTITSSASGVHTDNSGDAGGPSDVITSNNVSTCMSNGYGVWAFVPYHPVTISNNVVSGCDVGMAALGSCNFASGSTCGVGADTSVTFTGNQVTGNGATNGAALVVSTDIAPFGDAAVSAHADHNTLQGTVDGVYVEETGGMTATATVNRNSLAGTTHALNNAGATTVDASCDWWGQPNPRPVGNGIAVGHVTVTPWLQDSNLDGNCIPIMNLSVFPTVVPEGDSGTTTVMILVSLDRPSSQQITTNWTTVDGTATAGSDYVGASGSLTFNPGQIWQYIPVTINGDTQTEQKERFTVQLSGVHHAVPGNKIGPITILNDDKPTMAVANVSVTEGGIATFTVQLGEKYINPVTVTVSSSNGSASAPGDYTAVPNGTTITIPANTLARTVSVATKTDGITEGAETFSVTFTSSSTLNSPVVATGTIQANNT